MRKGIKIIVNTSFVKIKNLHKSCSWAIKNLKNTVNNTKISSEIKNNKNKYISDNFIYQINTSYDYAINRK